MSTSLEGRHVVITGGTGNLGGAVVDAFVRAGATCHVPVRGQAPAARERVSFAPLDLTDEPAVVAYYRGLPGLWASVHLAGGWAGAPITELSLADLRAQLDVNLVTSFLCAREAVRRLRGTGGRIVNVAARAAVAPAGGALGYTAAKAGVAAFTQGLAAEVRGDGILVNAIAPGTIDTPANRAAMPKADRSTWLAPAEIASVILQLASPSNTLVTGAIVAL